MVAAVGSGRWSGPRGDGYMMWFRVLLALLVVGTASAAGELPLELDGKIALGDVRGRIDHMAVDPARHRLYVAELGNDSVGVVDLRAGKTVRTISGLKEPQGIGYVPSTDTVYVANARDGSVRLFQGDNLTPAGQIALGEDADNVRVDDAANRILIGYGSGALAVIDTLTHSKLGDISVGEHPESFRLESSGSRIFVNVPDSREIAVVDLAARKQIAAWKTGDLRANFPLALDDSGQVLVVFRHPAKLAVFLKDGTLRNALDTCGDSDDLFVDSKRHRVYVSCGEGFIDVFSLGAGDYRRVLHLPTISGARTSLFVPQLDRLYLAARASGSTPPAVWVFRPQ